jgi:hypothetical protein
VSSDIFVQRLPDGVGSVADIPADFEPGPIGAHAAIVDGILDIFPSIDFTDPEWGRIEGDAYTIEVNLSDEDPVRSFALHVRGSVFPAAAIGALLDRLGCRALDPQSPTGIFDPSHTE